LKSNKLKLLTTKIGSGITPRGGSSVYVNKGTYLIRSQNVYNDQFQKNGLVRIDGHTAQKMKGVEVKENDVLINITGDSVARAFIISKQHLPARVNQHVSIIRTNSELNPYFLYYFLIDRDTQNYLLQIAGGGGTRNALTKEMLENLEITYPDIKSQNEIVRKLNRLKDLIEITRNQNSILDEISQTVFKSWFINFDGQTKFVNSDLGEIPKNWQIEKLGNHATIKGRIGWKGLKVSEYTSEGPHIITGPQILKDGRIDWDECAKVTQERYEESPEIKLKKYDILLTKDGTIGKLGYLFDLPYNTTVATGIFVIRSNSNIINQLILLYYFKSEIFRKLVASRIEGSVIPHLYQRDITEFEIVLPPLELVRKFSHYVETLIEKIYYNLKLISKLEVALNSIRPKLISGEIKA